MQKLLVKSKNAPENSPQVFCTVNSDSNKDQGLSDQNIVRTNNGHDVDQVQHTERSIKAKVYVLNKQGKPLMPCSYAKSKRMVKKGVAKIVKGSPFTIQLNFECENKIQKIVLGIDVGYKYIGFSAISEKEELISGEVILDNLMSKRLQDKAMYRRNRRNKLWYRKPRFLNRVSSKKEGWLAPSIQRRYQTHLTLIEKIKKLLPIFKTIIEIAKFDIQKIENATIKGKEYQQGDLYDYQNVRSCLMSREKGLCEHCKKNFKNNSSHIHHRKPISKGGSNRVENLMLVHNNCHKLIHKNEMLLQKYQKLSTKSYKHSAFMSIINKKFYKDVENLETTYGNITFVNRNKLNLEKSHKNDAFVIAGGGTQIRNKPFEIIQKRKNNRCLQKNRKGFKPSIRKQRYSIQPKDLVKINNKWFETSGSHCKGTRIMVNKKSISVKLVEKIIHTKTLIWRITFPPKVKTLGFQAI